jgi:predicted transcriptional regulator
MQKGNTVIIIEEFMQGVLGLSGTELMVYAVMYSFCKLSGSFYAAVCYLAARVHVSERTVQYALRRLCKRGYIKIDGKHEMYGTNVYKCIPPSEIEKMRENEASMPEESCATVSEERDEPFTAPSKEKGDEPFTAPSKEKSVSQPHREIKKAPPTFEEWKAEYYAYYIAEGLGEKPSGPRPMSYEEWQAAYDAYYGGTPEAKARVSACASAVQNKESCECDYAGHFMTFGYEGVVHLTDLQYEALCESVGEDMAELYILRLESYILENPHFRSHSHYKTILKWIKEDAELTEK